MKSIKGNLEERIVFLKLKSGDSDAFAYFYDNYVNRIYRYVYIKVSDRHTAEDLTQEIFLKIWQHMIDKKHIRNFHAYIFRIARNSVVDHYRSSQKQTLPLEEGYDSPELSDNPEESDKQIDKEISLEELFKRLKQLNPTHQEILLLRYVEDLSIDDIAQIVEKDKTNVRVIIHRAINKLKELTKE